MREGRRSVDAAISVIAAGGICLADDLFWRSAVEEGVRPCVDVVWSAFDPAR